MMTKKGNSRTLDNDNPMISGDEVLRLMSDANAFLMVSSLAIEKIKEMGADEVRYNRPIYGDRGWPAGIVWESLQTASHFNLTTSLELILKALVCLDCRRKEQDTHSLSYLLDSLTPSTRGRLEAAWTMVDKSAPIELVAFVRTRTRRVPSRPKNRDLNSLRDWFKYFDTDLQMYTKRYSWENLSKEKYQHYVKNLDVFYGVFEIIRILVVDRAKDNEVLLPTSRDEWRRSANFLVKSPVDLDSFYKKSGWRKDSDGRWTKRRYDGVHILVHRPDPFWRVLITEGENYLTVKTGRAWSSARDLGSGKYSDPVLVAELIVKSQSNDLVV